MLSRTPLFLAGALLVALTGLASAAPVAAEYEVEVLDAAKGLLEVTLTLKNPGVLREIDFLTADHTFTVSDVRSPTSDPFTFDDTDAGYRLKVDDETETVVWKVLARKGASRAGEYNAYLGPDWGVLKGDAIGVPFSYSYADTAAGPPEFQTTVRFTLPTGWTVAAPWKKIGITAFELPGNDGNPRGFIALGPFSPVEAERAGKTFSYVVLGAGYAGGSEELFDYVEAATPYYLDVYGPVTGEDILLINAPDPMFRGGLGSEDSLYVHDNVSLKTLAHEYAHVWQRFLTIDATPRSPELDWGRAEIVNGTSLWLNEGDADYHGPVSLFVTNFWTRKQLDDHFKDVEKKAMKDENGLYYPLTKAAYGTALEDVMYNKGAMTLNYLDSILKENTDGAVTLDAFLRVMNKKYAEKKVTNEIGRRELENMTQRGFGSFFNSFVYGQDYPPYVAINTNQTLVLEDLAVSPEPALPGDELTITLTVSNAGSSPVIREIAVNVNDTLLGTADVNVLPGERQSFPFKLLAQSPGTYVVRAVYLSHEFKVLVPASFILENVSLTPDAVEAGEEMKLNFTFVNRGETAGTLTASVLDNGKRLWPRDAPEELEMPERATQRITLTITLNGGDHELQILGTWPGGEVKKTLMASVSGGAPFDPGDLGLPKFPIGGNDTGLPVPGPGIAWFGLVAIAAALLPRRRRPRE
ncbi:MAG: hypothetical protein HY556_09705 [Euryarchaeota archaeon]|nr:hypothetical protein [Euryarchaeota archaeon]